MLAGPCIALRRIGRLQPRAAAASGDLGQYQPATLAEAVVFRNRTAVENFLALGVDPNEPEADGTTPLMRAVHGQMPEMAKLLIDAGADVRKANSYGVTALYIAARAGDAVATQMLLAAGADANAALPAGETVLMTAAKAGNADVVRALLTGGIEGVSAGCARRSACRGARRRSRRLRGAVESDDRRELRRGQRARALVRAHGRDGRGHRRLC